MTILEHNPVLCVNGFALSSVYEKIKPAYYVLADGAFWADELPDKTRNFVDSTLEAIATKTQWPMILFVPVSGVSAFKRKKSVLFTHPNILIQPYNDTVLRGFKCLVHACLRRNLGILSQQNVLIPSIILAINMRYKRVIILGADHSWHRNLFVNNENQVCLIDEHFYDEGKNPVPLMIGSRPSRLHEQFESIAKTLRIYWEITDYAQKYKAIVINASEVSFIDAFPRAKLQELF
ncbi:MAG: hypothetical protein ACP5PZ_04955 [Bacteroidales bacterium]